MSLTPRVDRLDKNFLINSAKDFTQRSTVAENLSASYQFLNIDRHVHKTAGSFNSTPTVQRVQDSPDGKTKYCSEMVADFASTSAELYEAQPVESVFSRDLVGENVSFSIWVKPDSCTTMNLRLYTADVEDDFTAVTQFHTSSKTITADSSWQEVKFENIAVAAGVERGLLVEVVLTDSDSTGVSETHRLARGKLNIGDSAQEWSPAGRDYFEELQMCQRYFESSAEFLFKLPGQSVDGSATGKLADGISYLVEKRTNPTVSLLNPNYQNCSNLNISGSVSNARKFIAEVDTDATFNDISVSFSWTADAEVLI